MNSTLKISILTAILSVTILGCGQGSTNSKMQDTSFSATSIITQTDSIADTVKVAPPIQSDFDIDKFIARANSLLSSMKGKSIRLTYKIDTIAVDTNKYSPLSALLPAKAFVKKYSFDPGKGSRELRFWLVDATYADKAILKRVFAELQHQSGKVNGKDDNSPGLTYSNDYVIRTDKKIFWLNSLCPFGFGAHQKLSHSLLQSLTIGNIKDSIHCKCGQPICGLKYP